MKMLPKEYASSLVPEEYYQIHPQTFSLKKCTCFSLEVTAAVHKQVLLFIQAYMHERLSAISQWRLFSTSLLPAHANIKLTPSLCPAVLRQSRCHFIDSFHANVEVSNFKYIVFCRHNRKPCCASYSGYDNLTATGQKASPLWARQH